MLRSVNPLQVDDRIIPDGDVVVLKTLSAKPVRNSDIRALETAKAAAFPGIDNQMIGGWLARAGDGITERSNSAVPIGPSAGLQEVPLAELQEFYRSHDLPCQLMIPDRIGRPAEHLPGDRRRGDAAQGGHRLPRRLAAARLLGGGHAPPLPGALAGQPPPGSSDVRRFRPRGVAGRVLAAGATV